MKLSRTDKLVIYRACELMARPLRSYHDSMWEGRICSTLTFILGRSDLAERVSEFYGMNRNQVWEDLEYNHNTPFLYSNERKELIQIRVMLLLMFAEVNS